VVRGAGEQTALAEVRIGIAREAGGITAQAAGNATVFELDPAVAEFVPVSLDALRTRFVAKPEEPEGAAPAAEGADAEPLPGSESP
jgi:hypothetical protein